MKNFWNPDLDLHQVRINSSLSHTQPVHQVSSKSVHNFFKYVILNIILGSISQWWGITQFSFSDSDLDLHQNLIILSFSHTQTVHLVPFKSALHVLRYPAHKQTNKQEGIMQYDRYDGNHANEVTFTLTFDILSQNIESHFCPSKYTGKVWRRLLKAFTSYCTDRQTNDTDWHMMKIFYFRHNRQWWKHLYPPKVGGANNTATVKNRLYINAENKIPPSGLHVGLCIFLYKLKHDNLQVKSFFSQPLHPSQPHLTPPRFLQVTRKVLHIAWHLRNP